MNSLIRIQSFLQLTLVAIFILAPIKTALSEEIYKSIDEQGREIFTSHRLTESDSIAELPEITRERARQIPIIPSCIKRGGISCDAGADTDGSVICMDGFKDALDRFNFRCLAADLSLHKLERKDDGVYIYLRNNSSVEAKDIVVNYRVSGTRKDEQLQVSDSLLGYGVTEVKLPVNVDEGRINIHCGNCRM